MTVASSVTVLIVDDDRGLVRLLQKALSHSGFSVAIALSGEEAGAWLSANTADLMLLDLKLQDIEGRELIDQLSKAKKLIPFIVITGQGDERVAVEMMKNGALDYVVKDAHFLEHVPAIVQRASAQVLRDRKLVSAEKALREAEARLQLAVRSSNIGWWDWDFRTDEIYFSPELKAQLGFQDHEMQNTHAAWEKQLHPEDHDRVMEAVQQSIRDKVSYTAEYRLRHKDGSYRWILSHGAMMLDEKGEPLRMLGTHVEITERKRLEYEISQVSEVEQRRIGQDLHDGICQQLAGIELMSQVLEQNLEKKSKTQAAKAGEIARHVREAIAQTRSLARGLSPVVLESEGLMAALQELSESTEKVFRVKCEFDCPRPVLVSNNTVATHLYRIAQEAMANAIRHGKAKRLEIQLVESGDKIVLTVRDNGTGFKTTDASVKGMGLRIMQYRAGMIGGTTTFQNEQRGALVTCTIAKSAANTTKAV